MIDIGVACGGLYFAADINARGQYWLVQLYIDFLLAYSRVAAIAALTFAFSLVPVGGSGQPLRTTTTSGETFPSAVFHLLFYVTIYGTTLCTDTIQYGCC